MTKTYSTIVSQRIATPGLAVMMPLGKTMDGHLFGILNLGHSDLFVPALARLGWYRPFLVSSFQAEVINTVGLNSVWARDLVFGAWDLHGIDRDVNFCKLDAATVQMVRPFGLLATDVVAFQPAPTTR